MAAVSKSTTDHEEIKKWVEERNGNPAVVKATKTDDPENIGQLRINFPGGRGEDSLEKVSWDNFFATFDHKNLQFLYQDQTANGEKSYFFKLIRKA